MFKALFKHKCHSYILSIVRMCCFIFFGLLAGQTSNLKTSAWALENSFYKFWTLFKNDLSRKKLVATFLSCSPISILCFILCYSFFTCSFFSLQVRDIALHPELFSVQNGLLTPTLKAKRTELRNRFREQIDQLYAKIKT